jgi:hypothetical protein
MLDVAAHALPADRRFVECVALRHSLLMPPAAFELLRAFSARSQRVGYRPQAMLLVVPAQTEGRDLLAAAPGEALVTQPTGACLRGERRGRADAEPIAALLALNPRTAVDRSPPHASRKARPQKARHDRLHLLGERATRPLPG